MLFRSHLLRSSGFGTSNMRPIIDGLTVGLQVLLLFIGMLTLAIGGIGLMNILLVSVNERTREIGLRRALGAKRWHIAMQFLAEALFITFAGGVVGVALLPIPGPLRGRHAARLRHLRRAGRAGLLDQAAPRLPDPRHASREAQGERVAVAAWRSLS